MATALVSPSLVDSLVEQIAHEKYNANLYLHVASFLNNKGLSNIAKHFEGQHEEEQGHAKILYQLLVDLGIHFPFPPIDGCDMNFNSFLDLTALYLKRETETTESLNEIKLQAMDEENPVVEERLREMILLQQHEYAEATDMYDKSLLLSEWWQVALFDASFEVG